MNADAAADRLAKLAESVAPEVLQEAVAEARRRAVDELADLLRPAILAAALGSGPLGAQQTRTNDSVAPDDHGETPSGAAVYAYGVVPGDVSLPDVTGVGDRPVRTVGHRDIALLVSDIEAELLQGLDTEQLTVESRIATLAQQHHEVVNAAFAAGPVVPLRFGTVLHDDAAATRMLDEGYTRWRADLNRITGAAEYTVRVLAGTPVEPQQAPARATAQGSESPGTAYLRARAEELSRHEEQQRAVEGAAHKALETLANLAAEVSDRAATTLTEDTIAEATYLVPVARQDEFVGATEEVARALASHGMTVRVSGPWPPYTFVRAAEAA
jgi:hypothetical protein